MIGPGPERRPISTASADPHHVRQHNLALVLRTLQQEGARSRATLASMTGIAKATMTSLVVELEQRGLVHEVGRSPAIGVGRPATLLSVDGSGVAVMGAVCHVGEVAVIVTDLAGNTMYEHHEPLAMKAIPPPEAIARLVALISDALVATAPQTHTVAGLTVAVAGVVDVERGVVRRAPNLGWTDLPLRSELQRALAPSFPVFIDNDASLGTLAEYHTGDYALSHNLVYILGDVGIGGGVVLEGRLMRGAAGFSSEIGHIPVMPQGEPCGCGARGCLETVIGLNALLRFTLGPDHHAVSTDATLSLEDKADIVAERARQGDARALAGLSDYAEWLAQGLITVVNLFNPDVIVLGGFFHRIAEFILPQAVELMTTHAIAPGARDCKVVASKMGMSAAVRGAALHSADRVMNDPTVVSMVG
jgi:predicted NBD/HSP70 family sugar kinase